MAWQGFVFVGSRRNNKWGETMPPGDRDRQHAGRVLIVGLDAVSWDVLDRVASVMPRLTALRAKGSAGTLASTYPPLTPVAWTSMVTGMGPGRHGVYEFFYQRSGIWTPVSRRECRAPALDEILQRQGMPSILINLPLSSPGRSEAIRLADFLARGEETVWPPSLKEESADVAAYRAFWDPAPFAARSLPEAALEVQAIESLRFAAGKYLLDHKPWRYAFYGITGTDHLQHRALHTLFEEEAPPPEVLTFYAEVDRVIDALADRMAPGDLLILAADHGSAVTHREFFLNEWLVREGLATWRLGGGVGKAASPGAMSVLRRLAFKMDLDKRTARLRHRLGQKKRLSTGPVAEVDDANSQAYMPHPFAWPALYTAGTDPDKLGQRLRALVDPETGTVLFDEVLLGKEVYGDRPQPGAPDLVLMPAQGVSVHPGRSGALVRTQLRNHHKQRGMLLVLDPGDRYDLPKDLGNRTVEDIAPTVLTALGLSREADGMDGVSLIADATREARRSLRERIRQAARTTSSDRGPQS